MTNILTELQDLTKNANRAKVSKVKEELHTLLREAASKGDYITP